MSLPFSKWEGLGNDFILMEAALSPAAERPALARALCDRRRGIGADGLLLFEEGVQGPEMILHNPDGSLAWMCGNGLRCLAAWAALEGRCPGEAAIFTTRAGPRAVRILARAPWTIEVEMGAPEPLAPLAPLEIEGRTFPSAAVSMGNPHRVVWVDRLEEVPLERWGPELGGRWPGGINVEFVEVLAPDRLAVRVWERGVGVTLACGTGACASLAVLHAAGACQRAARVELPGGGLEIAWAEGGGIRMVGPARELFRGVWRPDP